MTTHLEETVERDLQVLRERITGMSALAVGALEQCVSALRSQDRRRAYSVILRDQRIDGMEKEVDRLCLEFLVRHQPAGRQLRFVCGAIKINAGLERIGDYAESIARQILKTVTVTPVPALEHYLEISGMVIPMLRDAVRAYLSQDAELARVTMGVEAQADAVRDRINGELLRLHQQAQLELPALTALMTIARRFERVADQGKNICEETLYVVTGESAKHPGAGTWRILLVDEDQSCLAPMAEAIGRSLGKGRLRFESAGLKAGTPDPFTRDFLAGKQMALAADPPRALEAVPGLDHYQVAVCLGSVTPHALASLPAKTVILHWPVADPTEVKGTSEELHAAHEAALGELTEQVQALAGAILGDPAE